MTPVNRVTYSADLKSCASNVNATQRYKFLLDFEHLIMAMADAYNNRDKTTFFGNDRGLKSYVKFEEKLKDALIAMTMDGLLIDSTPQINSEKPSSLLLLLGLKLSPTGQTHNCLLMKSS